MEFMASSKRPNILLIMADQLRADHLGFGGNDIVRTPNLDRLAARSLVFDKCYVANPICMPNRCSILTGRVPTAHRVIFNDRSLPWGANTFVKSLAGAGYSTGLIGKAHFQMGFSSDSYRPLPGAPAVTDPYPAGWDQLEDIERYVENDEPLTDFYGFQNAEFSLGHGDMAAGHHYQWALKRGARPEDLLQQLPYKDWPVKERSDEWWQIYQPTISEELYSTTFVTERSIDWLDAQSDDAPWFLQCSYPDPHHPFTPPGKWWRAYDADDMPLPASFDDPMDSQPGHLKLIKTFEQRDLWTQMFGPTQAQLRHAMAAEFGMIEMIDEGIGNIIAALEANGALDNTIILFTSDHGDMFGDHGLMLKAMMHYEAAIRPPLVIGGPGVTAGRTASFASSLDLAQTILDVAGLPEFDRMQGVSLAPVLEDAAAEVRDHVYIEEDMPIVEATGVLPYKTRTLVTKEGRVSHYSTGDSEVYDHAQDPDEFDNRATTAPQSGFVKEMNEKLIQKLMQYSDLARVEPIT
jgi:arylsulfatase A-like enzyme